MTQDEARQRWTAAMAEMDGTSKAVLGINIIAGAAFRACVHLCVGFGACAAGGVSAWWGLPLALLSSLTLGQAWWWWRRDSEVRGIEAMVEEQRRRLGGGR